VIELAVNQFSAFVDKNGLTYRPLWGSVILLCPQYEYWISNQDHDKLADNEKTRIEKTNLIDFELEENRVDAPPKVYAPAIIDPYEDQTPHEIMSREYMLANTTLSSGGTVSYDLYALLNAQMPANVLALYKYFRYDAIEVKFIFTVDPQTFGVVAASWIPYIAASSITALSPSQRSQMAMEYVHVSSSTELVYTVPYENTQDFLNIGETNYINAFLHLWTITGLADMRGSVVTLDYTMYARYVNPHLAGFVAQSDPCSAGRSAASFFKAINQDGAGDVIGSITDLFCGSGGPTARGPTTTAGDTSNIGFESVRPTAIKNLVYGDWNRTHYTNDSQYLGAEDVAYHPKSAMFGKQMADVWITQLMQVPSITQVNTFMAINGNFTYPCILNPSTTSVLNGTYAAYLALLYLYWRGSIKIKVVLTGSPLVTSRVAMNLSWSTTATGLLTNNSPTRIITIRGPTEVEFSVPYLYLYPWMPTCQVSANLTTPQLGDLQGNYVYPVLNMTLINQQSPGSTFVTVPFFIVAAMGEDVEVKDLVYNVPEYTGSFTKLLESSTAGTKQKQSKEGNKIEAQGILDDFSKPFDVLGTRSRPLTRREPGDRHTVREILSHWSRRSAGQFVQGPNFVPRTVTQSNFFSNGMFDFLASIFVFNRFSLKIRAEVNGSATGFDDLFVRMVTWAGTQSTVNPGKNFIPDSGYSRVVVRLDPLLEFEVPFRCIAEMVTAWSIRSPSPSTFIVESDGDTSPALDGLAICAGRECEVSHLAFLPSPTVWPVTS